MLCIACWVFSPEFLKVLIDVLNKSGKYICMLLIAAHCLIDLFLLHVFIELLQALVDFPKQPDHCVGACCRFGSFYTFAAFLLFARQTVGHYCFGMLCMYFVWCIFSGEFEGDGLAKAKI